MTYRAFPAFIPKTTNGKWRIVVDLQVTKGAKSEQTYVVLQNCQGKKLEAYIQGTPQLSNGQIICSPKIVTRSHPAVGNYNIIESYNLAA